MVAFEIVCPHIIVLTIEVGRSLGFQTGLD